MNFSLLYTSDKSLLDREINLIKDKLKVNDESIISYNIEDVNSIIDEALTIGMFSSVKLIIINATSIFFQNKEIINIEKLESYFNNYNPNSFLVFISNSDSIDLKIKLAKLISSKGIVKKLEATKEYLNKYINNYLNNNSYHIDDINYFIEKVGTNVDNITNELDKLMLYKIDNKRIEKEDIDLLVIAGDDSTIYDLVNYMLKNNNKKAILLYKELIVNGMDSSQIIAVLASQIRLLFQVKRLYNKGKTNDEIAKILEFRSIYRVKYLLSDSYYYTEDVLLKYLSKLSDIDHKIKIDGNDGNVLLSLFIAGKDM